MEQDKSVESNNRTGVSRVARVMLILVSFIIVFSFGGLVGAGVLWFVGSQPSMSLLRPASSHIELNVGANGELVSRDDLVTVLWEAWDIIDAYYLKADALDAVELMRGAVRGMVDAVDDPYTLLVDPVPAAIISEDMTGQFEGIGVTVNMPQDDRLVAVQIIEGSPAAEAGLLPGDAVIAVDGTAILGLSMDDAIVLIRGPEGTDVTLTIEREGEDVFDVSVTRRRIEYPSVSFEMLEDEIGYIALREFNGNADEQLEEALISLEDEGAQGLILDLRSNPGGLLDQAIDVVGEFVPSDTLVVTEHGRGEIIRTYSTRGRGVAPDTPLVVLIDGGSASASEIVAGALQDWDRATLLGTQSFGKGSVQTLHTLGDGSQLRVTVAKYALPQGTFVDGVGITPDYVVELDPEAWAEGVDTQLDAAIDLLVEGELIAHAE